MFKKIKLSDEFLNSLEPHVSKETMHYHYNFHHTAYENGLNEIMDKIKLDELIDEKENKITINSLEDLMKNYMRIQKNQLDQPDKMKIRQFGGGLINHNFYFSILKCGTTLNKNSKLLKKIDECFGSFDNWKREMIKSALEVFGSGWTWLVLDKKNNLKIFKTFNQDNPWFLSLRPIIGIDVWEHAYYIDYRNDRKKYLENHMNIIDWNKVTEIYDKEMLIEQ